MKKSTLFLFCALVALVFASCKKEDPLSKLELKFSQSKVEIDEGGDYNLGKLLIITPQNVADTLTVNWKSEEPAIAEMVSKKWVYGVSMGETTVTAESHGKSASIKVIVNELPVTGLTIKDSYKGNANVPIPLDGVTLEPSGANLMRIIWQCSSNKVSFHYDRENRRWTAIASEAGTYTIIARVDDLEPQTATLTVSVKKISKIKLSETSIALLSEGADKRTARLTYTIEPEDASYKEVEWSVSGDDCIEFNDGEIVSKNGKEGIAVITLKHKAAAAGDIDMEAKCTVTVTKSAPVESFSLSITSKTIKTGESFSISVENVSPSTASSDYIHWESDSPDDVTLSAFTGASCDVIAKAKMDKTVKIKAVAPNGFEKVCTVTITTIPVQGISFNNESDLIAFPGTRYFLPKVTVKPSYATMAGDVEYKVSDPAVVITVGANEVAYDIPKNLTEVKTYTVTAKCGGKEASFTMYGVPDNYLNTIVITTPYSDYGTFGIGGKKLMPKDLIKSSYQNTTVASKVKLRYGGKGGTETGAIVETDSYIMDKEYTEYKYDYNKSTVGSSTFNRTNTIFRLALSDMKGAMQKSQTVNAYFYNSVTKYTYRSYKKSNDKVVEVTGDAKVNGTIDLNILRVTSPSNRIYCPSVTIYAEYYTNSQYNKKTLNVSYLGEKSVNGYVDETGILRVYSSEYSKSETGMYVFNVKYKK